MLVNKVKLTRWINLESKYYMYLEIKRARWRGYASPSNMLVYVTYAMRLILQWITEYYMRGIS